jgi:2-haloacid dehalogenase
MPVTACVFDAYGTLFDVAGAARAAAAEPGGAALAEVWPRLAADWRDRQLAYSWLRAVAGAHADFWQVTADALDWALAAHGLADAGLRDRLMALYRRLPAYPEVPATLAALRASGQRTAILSNGSPGMLADAIASAGLEGLFDAVLSVEEVGVFKPHPSVYALIGRHLGTAADESLFVSANGWDAACATGAGLTCAWLNRTGAPRERLPWAPAHELPDLSPLPDLLRSL